MVSDKDLDLISHGNRPPGFEQPAIGMPGYVTNQELRFAGFWIRFFASILDMSLVLTLSWAVEILGLGNGSSLDPMLLQAVTLGFYLSVSFGYYGWTHRRFKATLGKRLLGLEVVQS